MCCILISCESTYNERDGDVDWYVFDGDRHWNGDGDGGSMVWCLVNGSKGYWWCRWLGGQGDVNGDCMRDWVFMVHITWAGVITWVEK